MNRGELAAAVYARGTEPGIVYAQSSFVQASATNLRSEQDVTGSR